MKGMTIYFVKKEQIGVDGFGNPVYSAGSFPSNDLHPSAELYPDELYEAVEDCLVGQPSTDDVTNALTLYGKKVEYTIGIPKGDTHDWVDAVVEFFGARWRTIGYPMTGIQANIPLRWGQNIKVERYG